MHRLTPAEQYERGFRLKRASHASVLHAPIVKEEWTKPTEVRVFVVVLLKTIPIQIVRTTATSHRMSRTSRQRTMKGSSGTPFPFQGSRLYI
jgi:hypothetical protein